MQIFYWTGVILEEVSFALEAVADNVSEARTEILKSLEEIDQKKEDYDKCEGTLLRINQTETLGIDSSNMSYRHGVDPFSFHSNATVMAWLPYNRHFEKMSVRQLITTVDPHIRPFCRVMFSTQ
jgi:hypothetical protein